MARILVIDDEPSLNFLNVLLLKSIGMTDIEEKLSGTAGIEYLKECDKNNTFPELIFVDLNMTGMDGFMFLRQYEDNFLKYNDKARIIVLTNSILDREKDEAMKYPAVIDFWSKPLTKYKLQELLDKITP